ncbi:MAG: undecaprenyl/decaprenyl-phosphate alpha-N-acetylglucosaminyl 1-phosphate transferase [Leifsonia sp.]|nr:undecaprenyl/decaprenyl-phosphate alpha-N-acetylglucosaminyl 1-phosphate transferase [Leifsonia sp.]
MVFYVIVAGVSGLVTFGLSILIYRLSHRFRLYPKIRERDVHTRPTPRLGGIAMFLGILLAFGVGAFLPPLALVYASPGKILAILGAALLIVLIGVADDIWDLDWLTKLAGQMIAAFLLAWQGIQISFLPIPNLLVIGSSFMSLVITVFLIVLAMNAINFIDGLDGLVAGVALIANVAFFIYTYSVSYGPTNNSDYFNLAQFISAVLIGACVGFLPLNWHPARLFMGDAGALLVGMLMAASTATVTSNLDPEQIIGGGASGSALGASGLIGGFIPILLPFAILIVPLLDFVLAVFRRLRAGKSPFSADRKHLHHRLLDMGHTHFHAVLIFYAWTAVVSASGLLFLFVPDARWAVLFLVVGLVACTIVTLAPLSRRKAVEAAVQSASEETTADAAVASFDPLDAAADGRSTDAETNDTQAARALKRLRQKEKSS